MLLRKLLNFIFLNESLSYTPDRLVGVFRMVLQRLIQEGHLEVEESLVDMNNTVLKVIGSNIRLLSKFEIMRMNIHISLS